MVKRTDNAKRAAIWWVEWSDSSQHGSWQSASDAVADRTKKVRCYSVGILLANDEHGMVVASSAHGTEVSGVMTIPRAAILRAKRLR